MTYFTPWNVNCKNTKVTPLLCDHKELPIFMKESTMNWWFYGQSFDFLSKISKLWLYTKIGFLIFENHDYES